MYLRRCVMPNLLRHPPINEGMLNQVQHDAVYVKLNTTLVFQLPVGAFLSVFDFKSKGNELVSDLIR